MFSLLAVQYSALPDSVLFTRSWLPEPAGVALVVLALAVLVWLAIKVKASVTPLLAVFFVSLALNGMFREAQVPALQEYPQLTRGVLPSQLQATLHPGAPQTQAAEATTHLFEQLQKARCLWFDGELTARVACAQVESSRSQMHGKTLFEIARMQLPAAVTLCEPQLAVLPQKQWVLVQRELGVSAGPDLFFPIERAQSFECGDETLTPEQLRERLAGAPAPTPADEAQ